MITPICSPRISHSSQRGEARLHSSDLKTEFLLCWLSYLDCSIRWRCWVEVGTLRFFGLTSIDLHSHLSSHSNRWRIRCQLRIRRLPIPRLNVAHCLWHPVRYSNDPLPHLWHEILHRNWSDFCRGHFLRHDHCGIWGLRANVFHWILPHGRGRD